MSLGTQRFNLTDEHVALARQMNVSWGYCEWGAPCIDGKRPYGNGDLFGDMAKILGVPTIKDDCLLKVDTDALMERHKEMETALQVILASGSFEPGIYEATKYHTNWRLVP